MFQRLLDTESLTGGEWAVVLALSVVTPALVWVDKAIQLHRQSKESAEPGNLPATPAASA
jgi:P-type Ca2+ transporter type 2C